MERPPLILHTYLLYSISEKTQVLNAEISGDTVLIKLALFTYRMIGGMPLEIACLQKICCGTPQPLISLSHISDESAKKSGARNRKPAPAP
ncbi:MAG: hypothetical protein J6P20_03805 [Oscillospiraceae bacterium]|nr:hypothetical protein [Oscillospiraceae bacterium]